MMKKTIGLVVAILTIPLAAANGDVVYNLIESNGDILIRGFGSIDLGSTAGFAGPDSANEIRFNARNFDGTFVGVFPQFYDEYDLTGNLTVTGDWVSQAFREGLGGDPFQGIFANSRIGASHLFISRDYQSGDLLDFDATIFSTTFADLGFANGDSGTISWSNNGITESITMNWGRVPEPSSSVDIGVVLLLGSLGRRNKVSHG